MNDTTAAPRGRGLALLLLVPLAALLLGLSAGSALAAPVATNDQQGANDEPGQKDLTRFTIDADAPAGQLWVSFNWDDIAWSGQNTGDGCFLFDTDGDGNANGSVCVIVGGNPATFQSFVVYSCGDAKADRCTNPISVVQNPQTQCSASVTSTDPFAAGTAYPQDTTASCTIVLADVGGSSAVLLDACSYPSQEPNSDPSDCIVADTGGGLPVTFQSVSAKRSGGAVTLRWKTSSELDMLGYNVWIERNGKRVKLNKRLIMAKGNAGGSYSFSARVPKAKKGPVRMWLEVVNLDGSRSLRLVTAR